MKNWSSEIQELTNYYKTLSGRFPELEKELEKLIGTEDEVVILLYSRRCLEVMVTDICKKKDIKLSKTIPLKGIIDKLNKENQAPSHIITSMLNLNSISTYGAHPKEFDPRQVKSALNNLTTVVEWYLNYLNIENVNIKEDKLDSFLEEKQKHIISNGIKEPVSVLKQKKKSIIIISTILLISIVVIFAFDIFNIFLKDQFKKDRDSDGKISIAVLPFQNLSGDTLYDVWQGGFQNLLISTLSNSEELSVRQYQAINNILYNRKNLNFASLTPDLLSDLSNKLETKTFILGNILKAGDKIRANAQLIDAKTEEIYKTYQVDGDSENDIFKMADSLSALIKNYIEIKKFAGQYVTDEIYGGISTNSSEAFKYYIHGYDAIIDIEPQLATEWFSKAIQTDSSFINAYVLLSYAYQLMGNNKKSKHWVKRAYKKREGLPIETRLILDHLNAYFHETPNEEIKYLKQLLEVNKLNTMYWHQLAFAYFKLKEYDNATLNWDQAFAIHEKRGTSFHNPLVYFVAGLAYHKTDRHDKEEEILNLGISLLPDNLYIITPQAICALSRGDKKKADELITKYKSIRENVIHCSEANISAGLAYIYTEANRLDEAEALHRKAFKLEPEAPSKINNLAYFLINHNINIDEGLELAEKAMKKNPDSWAALDTKGWGLYKKGKNKEALDLLKKSWKLKPIYDHDVFVHIQEVEQSLKNNE
ncbi:MAG: hypothetical protein ABFS35_21210 [Bacteroidota bacterium]